MNVSQCSHDHVWVDHFWTADDYPQHPAALDGFVYWQQCRDCEVYRNPEPIVLGQSAEPLTTADAEPLSCFICNQVAVVSKVTINDYTWSRYPLCADCVKLVMKNALRGRRTRIMS